jgi:hypothetical protein
VEDKEVRSRCPTGGGQAGADDVGEGLAPCRDVCLVAVWIERSLGLKVGVERGKAGSETTVSNSQL